MALALGVALMAGVGMLTGSAQANDDPQAPSLYKLLIFASGAAAFVSVFVVANTFAFAVAQRRRETALLRAIGATTGQITQMVLGEALLVAAAASIFGGLAALALAPSLAAWLVQIGAAPPGFGAEHTLSPLLIAGGVGLLVALAGTCSALWRAETASPVEALRQAAADRTGMTPLRWMVLALQLAGTVFLVIVYRANPASLLNDPGMRSPEIKLTWTMLFALMTMTTVIVLAPLLVPLLVRALTLPLRLSAGPAGLLARQNALTQVRRTISTAVPTFLVVATAGCVIGGVAAFGNAWNVQETALLRPGYVADHISPSTVTRLKTISGVTTTAVEPFTLIDPVSDRTTDYAAGPVVAGAIDGDIRQAWNLTVTAGSLADLHGSTAAASSDLARFHAWHIGDNIHGALPDGSTITLRLAALYRPAVNLPEVLLPTSPSLPTLSATAYLSAPSQPATASQAALLSRTIGGTVLPAHDWLASRLAVSDRYDRITMLAITGPPVLYALIAIINTMIMSTRDREQDLNTLRLAGSGTPQLMRMVALESAVVVTIASLLALLVTVGIQYATTAMINHDVLNRGQTIPLRLPWTALAASTVLCLALAVTSSLASTRRNTRTPRNWPAWGATKRQHAVDRRGG